MLLEAAAREGATTLPLLQAPSESGLRVELPAPAHPVRLSGVDAVSGDQVEIGLLSLMAAIIFSADPSNESRDTRETFAVLTARALLEKAQIPKGEL